jgi:hypothetical protein
LKGREEANFILTIEERVACETLQALMIGEPVMIEESGRNPMEDLAIVVTADIVSPMLKIDQQVSILLFAALQLNSYDGEICRDRERRAYGSNKQHIEIEVEKSM